MPKTATGHKTATPPFLEIGELLHKNWAINQSYSVLINCAKEKNCKISRREDLQTER